MSTNLVSGLSEIVDDYDLFLIDQWGVIHNGETAHDGALEALAKLHEANKRVIILSNSGKRVEDSFARMERMGVKPDYYDHVVTSGEMVHRNFLEPKDPFYAALGKNYVIFSWNDDSNAVTDGSDKQKVDDIDDADFILCTGTDQGDLDFYRPILEKAVTRNLPLICANPDLVSVAPDGTLNMCPGMVAKTYEEMGGPVRWHGKPQKETYDHCKALAPDCTRILGIGDSLRHDIKGANDAGGDGLFVCGGIHADEVGNPPNEVALANLFDIYAITPKYSVARFVW